MFVLFPSMKMKYLLPVLCALAVFSSVNLMAQSDPNNSSTPPPAAPAVHVGQNNPYKIGTAEDPVIAKEYLAFLTTKAGAHQATTTPFYDNSFMVKNSWDRFGSHVISNPNACISFTINSPDHCSFDLLIGHENDIIDGVQSEQVQKGFNVWRQNPTVSELCDYMNNQIAGNNEAVKAIKSRYPTPSPNLFETMDGYAANYNTYSTKSFFEIFNNNDPSFHNIEIKTKAPRFAIPLTNQQTINSLLFFFNNPTVGYSITSAFDISTSSTKTFQGVFADCGAEDEACHFILEYSNNPTSPAAVVFGCNYYRPSSVLGTTPSSYLYDFYEGDDYYFQPTFFSTHFELFYPTDDAAIN